jgi:hypothetical protein
VSVLQGIYMRHIDPDRGHSNAARFQRPIYLLGSIVVVAHAVDGKACDGLGEGVVGEGKLMGLHAACYELFLYICCGDVDRCSGGQLLDDDWCNGTGTGTGGVVVDFITRWEGWD